MSRRYLEAGYRIALGCPVFVMSGLAVGESSGVVPRELTSRPQWTRGFLFVEENLYTPSLAEVRDLAKAGNLVPVYREILADLETPVSAYMKVASTGSSFLLESVEGGERLARYSFIGCSPFLTVRIDAGQACLHRPGRVQEQRAVSNPMDLVRELIGQHRLVAVDGLPRFHGGAVGYLGYECSRYFERLPTPSNDPLNLPEAILLFTDTLLVFDHIQHKIKVVSHVNCDDGIDSAYASAVDRIDALIELLRQPLPAAKRHEALPPVDPTAGRDFRSNMSQAAYEKMVAQGKEYILAGDVIQVVLSQRFSRPTSAEPLDIYRALRTINPSPYMFFLDLEECHIIGASPELLVQVEEGNVTTHPIAGTRWRGRTPEEDVDLEHELINDEKERAEHIMLVDLGRNDIGRVSQPGTVQVPRLMGIDRLSHVMHLVSQVTGRLQPEMDQYDAFQACFPAGTISGAPKIRAMEIIAELEPDLRGPYSGAVGYFGYSGNLDTAIAIRTMVMKDGIAHVQAGAGIVADSVPEREHTECLNKARALLHAVAVAEELHD